MRKLTSMLIAGTLGTMGALALVSTASAAPADTKNVSVNILNRPDSATDNSVWAHDTFKRDIVIEGYEPQAVTKTEATPTPQPVTECDTIIKNNINWTYKVSGKDKGKFETTNTTKSPRTQAAMKPGLVGDFNGDWKFEVTAPANFCTLKKFDNTPLVGKDIPSTSGWVKFLFGDKAELKGTFTQWKWTYTLCNETYVNADKTRGGNKGDITGFSSVPCKSVEFVDTCDGVTIKLKNSAANALAVGIFKVGETEYTVNGGESKEVKVANPTAEIKVYGKIGKHWKLLAKHTWKKPNCSTPTPTSPATPTPNPGTGGGNGDDGPTLPVTGAQAWGLGITALAAIAVGAFFMVAARRRDQEIVTELPE